MKSETIDALNHFTTVVTETIMAVRNYGEEASVRDLLAARNSLYNCLQNEKVEE